VLRAALSTPGVLRLFLASVVGRLPIGAIGLILILRTQEMTGSYAAGGVVAGANAIAHGLGAPLIGRLIDKRGQTGVFLVSGAVFAAALTGLGLLRDGAPLAPAILFAAVAGVAFPPFGAALRALWTTTIEDPVRRHAIFSFESAVFELVYIAGPSIFVAGLAALSLTAAIFAAGAVGLIGACIFAATEESRTWRSTHQSADWAGALRGGGVRVLIGALLVIGLSVGAVEIGVAASASRGDAAIILSLWGVGSFLGGIAATRLGAPADPGRRVTMLFAALALGTSTLAFAGDTLSLAVLAVVAGLGIAPSLACAFALLGQVAPTGTVTEAYTWVSTGFGGGIAAGSALGGWVVEVSSATTTFALAALAAGAAAVVVSSGRHTLREPISAAA
jgi:MFS family permease